MICYAADFAVSRLILNAWKILAFCGRIIGQLCINFGKSDGCVITNVAYDIAIGVVELYDFSTIEYALKMINE